MLPLPNGPWSPIVIGNWDGTDITYYENPEKEVMTVIFDKKGEKIRGIVLLLTRFFLVNGDFSKALDSFSAGNVVMLKKKTPTTNLNYVAVVTDPMYAQFSSVDILKVFNNQYAELERLSIEFRKLAAKTGMPVTELKNANEEVAHRLFGEPLALPTMIVRKAKEGTTLEMNTGKLNIGLKLTGEKATQIVQNLAISAVVGTQWERIVQVLIEEAVLNGVTVVLYDDDGKFENINKPNTSLDGYQKFELSQPMGMPMRSMEPGIEVFIEISLFDAKNLVDLFGLGTDAEDILDEALKKMPENLEELEKAIENAESKKYLHERVLRVLKFIEREHGDLFKGNNDAREILAPWLKKMGRVTYINLSGIPEGLREGLKYSVTKAIHRFLKSETPRGELHSLSIIKHSKTRIHQDYMKTLKVLTMYGHGFLYIAGHELDLDEDIKNTAKLIVKPVNRDEVVVVTPGEKEYRVKVRPTLSQPSA